MVKRKLLYIGLFLLILLSLVVPTSALAAGYTLYEYYNTGDDASVEIYGANWFAQTFTTAESHTTNTIRLELYKEGTPGVLTVSVKEVDGSDKPTGLDLCSGTYDGTLLATGTSGTWREIILDEESLDTGTTYAIVARGTGVDATNNIHWMIDGSTATYAGGNELTSTDGGVSWTADTDDDYMFEVYGNPALEVAGANVYTGFLEEDDWLIVTEYTNIFTPYYPYYESSDYFMLQLVDNVTVKAQVPLVSWGMRPGSIYLSAESAASLEWGSAYNITMYGTFGSNPSATYTLTSGDWKGSNLGSLDAWCLLLAFNMGDYYGTEFTAYTVAKGEVLNEEGGVIFTVGIPGLPEVRPGIFQYVIHTIDYTETEFEYLYQAELEDWETTLGSTLSGWINDGADAIGISGRMLAGIGFIGIFAIIVIIGAAGHHALAGVVLASPLLLIGAVTGPIPLVYIGIAVVIIAVMAIKGSWWSST